MRFICTLWLSFFIGSLAAQDSKLESLKEQYLEAEGRDKLEALNEYIASYVRVDRLGADSLINDFFDSNQPDQTEILWSRLYFRMADVKYFTRDYQNAQAYLDSAILNYQTSSPGTNEDFASAYNLKGILFQRYKTYDSANANFSKAIAYAQKADSEVVLAKVYNSLGTNHWYQRDYASALKAYNQSLEIRKTFSDTSDLAHNYRNIGLTYKSIGDYPMALQYYEKALPFFNGNENQSEFGRLLNSIGLLYKELADFDQSIAFYNRSMAIRKVLGDTVGMTASLDNLGAALIEKGDFGAALENLLRSEQLKEGIEGDIRIYNTLANIGICYDKLEQHRQAKTYFDRAIAEAGKVDEKRIVALAYNNLNLLYRDEGKYRLALDFGLKSLSISSDINTPEALAVANHYLADTYKALGQFGKALEHWEIYSDYQFQLYDQKAATERSRMLVKYDFDQQQQELLQREKTLESLERESALSKSREAALLVVVLALLIVISLLIFIFRSRLKKGNLEQQLIKSEALLAELNKENLDQKLHLKEVELTAYAEQLSQKNELIASFEKQLSTDENASLISLATQVEGRSTTSISWEEFRLKFDQVHGHFVPGLNNLHQDLTNNELDISILLRINLTNKDIACILGASYESVKKSVQRLYKKLSLSNADDLRGYLLQI